MTLWLPLIGVAGAGRGFYKLVVCRTGEATPRVPPAHADYAALAQMVRALDCGSRGPPFDPGRRYHASRRAGPSLRENTDPPAALGRGAALRGRRCPGVTLSRRF